MPDPDFITVGNYTSLPEAELAQGILVHGLPIAAAASSHD